MPYIWVDNDDDDYGGNDYYPSRGYRSSRRGRRRSARNGYQNASSENGYTYGDYGPIYSNDRVRRRAGPMRQPNNAYDSDSLMVDSDGDNFDGFYDRDGNRISLTIQTPSDMLPGRRSTSAELDRDDWPVNRSGYRERF